MPAALHRILAFCLILAPLSAFAKTDWQQPTVDELKMTSYAADPNAPAVYLFREETDDADDDSYKFYARIKIFTEKGRTMFSDIEIPYFTEGVKVTDIEGRTIHPDGTVVPFIGKPYEKLLLKQGHIRIMAKVFSLPDVQIGSILEYRYKVSAYIPTPEWLIQQQVPVLKAHYNFRPDAHSTNLLSSFRLPDGDKLVQEKNGSSDLTIENVPALPNEDFLPPLGKFAYRVNFYYSWVKTSDEYWRDTGEVWSKGCDQFAKVSGKIRDAVNGIVGPTDTDQQKVEKIYAALMKIENTSFTRERSEKENKAEHLKVKTAQDIWAQQRGNGNEIALLFVAMVRAAGLKAYAAIVVDRNENLFDQNYLNWRQMDDDLAIVSINGHEVFFDPGQRYCEFAKLHWKHTWAGGIRQTDHGTEVFTTPGPNYKDNTVSRSAQLTLDPDGHVHGVAFESMTGVEALAWRQIALETDEAGASKQFEDELQKSMPVGVQVKLNHFVSLTDFNMPLTAILNISGTMGTRTGKHLFLPAVFFESGNGPLFAATERKNPVDMHYPYQVKDQFTLILPSNFKVENLPKQDSFLLAQNGGYGAKFAASGNTFAYGRLLRVASFLYKTTEYPSLRGFFQKVGSDDQQQVVLKVGPSASAGGN